MSKDPKTTHHRGKKSVILALVSLAMISGGAYTALSIYDETPVVENRSAESIIVEKSYYQRKQEFLNLCDKLCKEKFNLPASGVDPNFTRCECGE